MDTAISLVKFKDTLEENPKNSEEHFGILFNDGDILCFCCGGCVEFEDYEITENFNGFAYLDNTLKEYY
jgi:hypothetical protein